MVTVGKPDEKNYAFVRNQTHLQISETDKKK